MAAAIDFFVDTSILIAHLRQKAPTIFNRALDTYGAAGASGIVAFELEVGARRVGRRDEFQSNFSTVPIYPLTHHILMQSAEIHAQLIRQNQIIGVQNGTVYHRLLD